MLTRTNSEAILGALAPDLAIDFTEGVAITSSWHPDEFTHIEPVRYGKGSNAMALMQTVLADDTPGQSRVRTWLRELWAQRRTAFDLYDFEHWSERTVIALVMQTFDNSITTKGVKGRFGWRMTSEQGHGLPNPTHIPRSSTGRRPPTSSAAARSATPRSRASSTPGSGSSDTRGCTWSTGRRSRPTSG